MKHSTLLKKPCAVCRKQVRSSQVVIRDEGRIVGHVCGEHTLHEVVFAQLPRRGRLMVNLVPYTDDDE